MRPAYHNGPCMCISAGGRKRHRNCAKTPYTRSWEKAPHPLQIPERCWSKMKKIPSRVALETNGGMIRRARRETKLPVTFLVLFFLCLVRFGSLRNFTRYSVKQRHLKTESETVTDRKQGKQIEHEHWPTAGVNCLR